MKLRTPKAPAGPRVTELSEALGFEVVNGLLSRDWVELKEGCGRFLHPDVNYTHHLFKVQGRWEVFKMLKTDSDLFDMHLKNHTSALDSVGQKHVVYVDQMFRPRIPLGQYLLPEVCCPTMMHMTWQRQPDGTFLVIDVQEFISTTYLPNLLGTPGHWLQQYLVQPLGTFAFSTIFETNSLLTAFKVFIQKQFLGGTTSSNVQSHPVGISGEPAGAPTSTAVAPATS